MCTYVCACAGGSWLAVIAVLSAECPARCKQQLMSVFIARCIEVHGGAETESFGEGPSLGPILSLVGCGLSRDPACPLPHPQPANLATSEASIFREQGLT